MWRSAEQDRLSRDGCDDEDSNLRCADWILVLDALLVDSEQLCRSGMHSCSGLASVGTDCFRVPAREQGDFAHEPFVLRVRVDDDVDTRFDGLAEIELAYVECGDPGGDGRTDSSAVALVQVRKEVVLAFESGVERRDRALRLGHDVADGDLLERFGSQEIFRGLDDSFEGPGGSFLEGRGDASGRWHKGIFRTTF